jgi:NADH-quinone oxidoreductase subunit M
MSLTDVLILVPLLGGIAVWLAPLPRELSAGLAFLVALVEVALWITTIGWIDFDDAGLQLSTRTEWFDDLEVSYHVGLYSWSVWLVGVTVVVCAAALGYALVAGRERARAYGGLMLFLTGAVVGVFAAQDLLLFYVFFEAMLIPIYVLVGVWGGPGRIAATVKFVIYTMVGSLLMLASIVAYGIGQGTFSLVDGDTSDNVWIFLGFAVAFAVKAPLFPFHGWLLDAYRESTPEVAAVLSGVVSKAAVYGFIRIAIEKFPEPADDFTAPILVLAAIGLAYGSLLAFRAPDLRGVLAYSSMAQMGLIVLGIFAFNDLGLDGAILQAVNHGLVSASMFLLAGMVERRTSTGDFALLGGMARGRPALATVLMTTGIIALAVPGATTFAGEFLILAGVFEQGWGYAAIGAAAIVLAAMYVLRLISAVLHREPGSAVSEAALDLRPAELGIVVPLVVTLLALSAWPAAVSDHAFAASNGGSSIAGTCLEGSGEECEDIP